MDILDIRRHYNHKILTEAVHLFGFNYRPLMRREGSSYVYEGIRDDLPRFLKIVPGVYNTDQILAGGTEDQLLGEIEFVLYLAEHGVRLAMPLRSCLGNWVESIPVTDRYCFLVYCFEKAPGYMFPDQDEVFFPEYILTEWGRMHAVLHNLAEGFEPSAPRYRRLNWDQDDRLAYWDLIPREQTLVYQRYGEILEQMLALPRTPQVYGLTHGDFHHGNFFVADNQIVLFDFDAAQYFWYPGEISIPLYNCLPLPRSDTTRRRTVSLQFLRHFLKGYRQERYLDPDWLEILPLFLKFQEFVDYAYRHKYWDLSNLSARQSQVLQKYQSRIEDNIPVVSFEDGDLQTLYHQISSGG